MSFDRAPVAHRDADDLAIEVTGVSKAYQVYARPQDRLKQMAWMGKKKFYREFWALKNIDLKVARGQTVGIVGRNGSGKSTLLQVICGTLQPTAGEVRVRGRIAALLELGAGFNPEFTGRDNVYVYGSVLGLTQQEIGQKLQAILDFAEIGQFIDMPVKTYSSGMFVRLAFSVAINVDPDILVVDEALAVGDGRFQHRCMARIRQLQASGVSILYVSHDAEGVRRLCDHVVVLQDGLIVNQGLPLHMSNWYLALMTANYDLEKLRAIETGAGHRDEEAARGAEGAARPQPSESRPNSPAPRRGLDVSLAEFKYFRHGDGNAAISDVFISDSAGNIRDNCFLSDAVLVNVAIRFKIDLASYVVGVMIRDRLGTNVIAINTFQERAILDPMKAGQLLNCCFEFPLDLKPGFYSLSAAIAYDQDKHEWLDYIDNILIFRVVDRQEWRTVFGVYLPSFRTVTCRRAPDLDANDASSPSRDPSEGPVGG